MDKHTKTTAPHFTHGMHALKQHKRVLDTESANNIRTLLKRGVSRKAICSMYSLEYSDLKQFK